MRNKMISVVKSGLFALFSLFIGATAHATIGLPSGYTEVEYLQSNNNAYIDTGIVPKTFDYEIETVASFNAINGSGSPAVIWGFMGNVNAAPRWLLASYNSGYLLNLNATSTIPGQDTSKHTFIAKTFTDGGNAYWNSAIDGVVKNDNTLVSEPSTFLNNTLSIYLFARNNLGSNGISAAGNFVSAKIYSFKVTKAGSLIAHYIPVKYVSGNTTTYGMYDLMESDPSKAFHTNKGSGSFTGGPEMPSYTKLAYIESNGTQYIDTGISGAATWEITAQSEPVASGNGNKVLVGRYNTNATWFAATSLGYWGAGTAEGYYTSVSNTTKANISATFTATEVSGTVNGESFSRTGTAYDTWNNYTLLGYNNNYLFSGKLYSAKCTQNGRVVFNGVPAQRDSDGVVGLFDTISRRFLYNATYPFTGGTSDCPNGGVLQTYTSATGTVSQNGTPTLNNPVEVTFYTQGNMVLRKINDTYYDSYDATTGKITRRVGMKMLDGTQDFKVAPLVSGVYRATLSGATASWETVRYAGVYFPRALASGSNTNDANKIFFANDLNWNMPSGLNTAEQLRDFLTANPTPIYYPLAEANWYTEDWAAEQCVAPIKIATNAFNAARFSPVITALNGAIDTIKTVVANTISQTTAIGNLQSGKQTRPADAACPNYRQCLLVEDSSGVPHWYEIMDPFYNLFKPAIINNISAASVTSAESYTQLEYIRSDGTAYIDTGYTPTANTKIEVVAKMDAGAGNVNIAGSGCSGGDGQSTYSILTINSYSDTHPEIKFGPSYNWNSTFTAAMTTKQTLAISQTQFTVDGDVLATNTTAITCPSGQGTPAPFYLFQRWRPTITSANNKVQIYGFRIYENNVLQMNLVPAKLGNTVGMYNTVNGDFLTTPQGALTAGTVVANTDVPSTPTWTATFAANNTYNILASTVYGSAKCNATSGSANTAATSTQMSNANWNTSGNYCWCHVNNVTDSNNNSGIPTSNIWVWVSMSSGTCSTSCANKCATTMQTGTNTAFRKAITGIQ